MNINDNSHLVQTNPMDQFIVITRRDAHERGLKKFYTGKPCRRGHLALRWTVSGSCEVCQSGHQKGYVSGVRDFKRYQFDAGLRDYNVTVHFDDWATIEAIAKAMASDRLKAFNLRRLPVAPAVQRPDIVEWCFPCEQYYQGAVCPICGNPPGFMLPK